MQERIRRGQSGAQVSTWHPSSDDFTPSSQTSFFAPYGLELQQTITSSGSVTIPAGIEWVYVVLTGAGGSMGNDRGGGAGGGGVAWGWTPAQNVCIIGASAAGQRGGYSRYGHIIAGGGGRFHASIAPTGAGGILGGGGAGGATVGITNGQTNMYGMPNNAGAIGTQAPDSVSGGSGSGAVATANTVGFKGGNGISGGGGGIQNATGATNETAGAGGDGMVGGGGGSVAQTTGTRTGGKGGNGIGIDGTIYTGGAGSVGVNTNGAGGGGAGIAANGGAASGVNGGNGGLGGGGGGGSAIATSQGVGGAGILYIWY